MLAGIECVLFSRQPKTVETHWVEHIVTFESLESAVDVRGDVTQRMAYVQTGATWIREHVEHVVLWLGRIV